MTVMEARPCAGGKPGPFLDLLLDLQPLVGYAKPAWGRLAHRPRSLAAARTNPSAHHAYWVAIVHNGKRVEHSGITLDQAARSLIQAEFPNELPGPPAEPVSGEDT